MDLVKPIVAEVYDCLSRGNFLLIDFRDFSDYLNFYAKIGTSDFLIEISKITVWISFEDFMEEIKALATAIFSLSFEINK